MFFAKSCTFCWFVVTYLFEDPVLQRFQLTLDAEIKHLASKGKGVKKQAQPIDCEEEE